MNRCSTCNQPLPQATANNAGLPRGIRNHNPGNIKHSPANAWRGLSNPPSDGVMCIFTEAKWGIRALAVLLRNYQRNHKLNTIAGIIGRWAPPSENDTQAYINHVSRILGVDANATIDVMQEDIMLRLAQAIIRHENGQQPYSTEALLEGIRL